MLPINAEYKERVHRTAKKEEISIMSEFLLGLESIKCVECVFMRHDFSKPGRNIMSFTIVSDGVSEEVEKLKLDTEEKLLAQLNNYDYQIEVVDLNHILSLKDGVERNIFRMHLTDLYSTILLDRHGYFTRLQEEIVNINGPLGQISEYESLGDLSVDKEISMIFNRTFSNK